MAELRQAAHAEKLFSWPTPQDYNEAVQSPAFCFNDAELKAGFTELNEFGLPRPISGGFASVYHVRYGEREFAVRCFLSRVSNLQFRYEAIMEHLRQQAPPWAVPCEFIEHGMLVGSSWYPILKMEWIKGDTLGAWIEKHLDQPEKLQALRDNFCALVAGLKSYGIAHGDLQPGNILVREDASLYLCDYDGMYVPGLAGAKANELGHKNFQHPTRSAVDFGPSLDNFSAWLISTSVEILMCDPALWQQLNCGDDALLFRHADLDDPDHSYTFSILEAHCDERIVQRARMMRTLARGSFNEVPDIDASVDTDEALPEVVYTPPAPREDMASFQMVPRPMHRPRKKKKKAKVGGGAMAAISASIASSFALDSARNRKVILYPTLVLASLIVIGTVAMRMMTGSYLVYDKVYSWFKPAGVNLFDDAHASYDRGDIYAAEIGFSSVVNRFSEPGFGLKSEDLIEAYVHRAEIAHTLGANKAAKGHLVAAERLARQLRQREPGREEPYEADYFTQQELLCDVGSGDNVRIAETLSNLFAKNPETARWTPWDLGRVFALLAKDHTKEAIEYWKSWQAAVAAQGYDGHLYKDMTNLLFVNAQPLAESDDPKMREKARQLYQLILNTVNENYEAETRQDIIDALAGQYYIYMYEGNTKEANKIADRMKQMDISMDKEDRQYYEENPPTREYNPERYHSD